MKFSLDLQLWVLPIISLIILVEHSFIREFPSFFTVSSSLFPFLPCSAFQWSSLSSDVNRLFSSCPTNPPCTLLVYCIWTFQKHPSFCSNVCSFRAWPLVGKISIFGSPLIFLFAWKLAPNLPLSAIVQQFCTGNVKNQPNIPLYIYWWK